MSKQYYRNYKDFDFAKILSLAKPSKFPKICDFCGEIFEASLILHKKKTHLKCPVCYAIYRIVYNELNDFHYLEFVKIADSNNLEAEFFSQ